MLPNRDSISGAQDRSSDDDGTKLTPLGRVAKRPQCRGNAQIAGADEWHQEGYGSCHRCHLVVIFLKVVVSWLDYEVLKGGAVREAKGEQAETRVSGGHGQAEHAPG